MIGEPPMSTGAAHETVTFSSRLETTTTERGASGFVAGVIESENGDSGLRPALLRALTVKV
jgi:hypothetical protein